MYSDSREYGKITATKNEIIRDRKENFIRIADNAKSNTRFQLIVSGFETSLIGFLVSNGIISIQKTINSPYTLGGITLLALGICLSFLTDHNARKRANQQSKLLFDDHIYDQFTTDEKIRDRILRDRMREDILRWMVSISTAATIIAVFLFLLGTVDAVADPSPLIFLVLIIVLLGVITFYLLSLLGAMFETLFIDIIRFHRRKPIWRRLLERVR